MQIIPPNLYYFKENCHNPTDKNKIVTLIATLYEYQSQSWVVEMCKLCYLGEYIYIYLNFKLNKENQPFYIKLVIHYFAGLAFIRTLIWIVFGGYTNRVPWIIVFRCLGIHFYECRTTKHIQHNGKLHRSLNSRNHR